MNTFDILEVGSQHWFEYHCFESDESSDATLWHHSHQQVVILKVADWEPASLTMTRAERESEGMPLGYTVSFADGFEYDVFEDELVDSPAAFERDDPPGIPMAAEELRRLRMAHNRDFIESGRCNLNDGYHVSITCSQHP